MEIVLLTGMSGAGRSTAAHALEDLGFFVTDNLPPQLIADVIGIGRSQSLERLAVVVDVRGGSLFTDLEAALDGLRTTSDRPTVVFLDRKSTRLNSSH